VNRCFVGFFGLNRSLKWTFPSIQAQVLRPLYDSGLDLSLAGHFNCPEVITNVRSRENGVPLDMSSVHQLDLQMVWQEGQTVDSIDTVLPHAMSVPYRGYKDHDGQTRRNAMFQLYSLKQLWRMQRLMAPDRFDFYCLLRPDLEYLDPLPIAQIIREITNGKDLLTPNWHRWGGLNDRFAFCSPKGAEAYMLRFDDVGKFCQTHSYFHSEEFLKHAARHAGLSTGFLSTRARRVRSTGEVCPETFPKPAA